MKIKCIAHEQQYLGTAEIYILCDMYPEIVLWPHNYINREKHIRGGNKTTHNKLLRYIKHFKVCKYDIGFQIHYILLYSFEWQQKIFFSHHVFGNLF